LLQIPQIEEIHVASFDHLDRRGGASTLKLRAQCTLPHLCRKWPSRE
jgi:hypothetical protein